MKNFHPSIWSGKSIKCASAGKNGEKQVRKCEKMGKNEYFLVKIG